MKTDKNEIKTFLDEISSHHNYDFDEKFGLLFIVIQAPKGETISSYEFECDRIIIDIDENGRITGIEVFLK